MKNLFPGWLFFVFLPALGLSILVDQSLTWEETRIEELRRSHLLQEMQAYIAELEPLTYLERNLKAAVRKTWSGNVRDQSIWNSATSSERLATIRADLEKHLGFNVAGIVCHGPDVRTTMTNLDPGWRERLTPGMLSRLFWIVNHVRPRRQAISTPLPPWIEAMKNSPRQPQETRSASFFSFAVGNAVEAEFKPWRLACTLSRWLQGGRLYWLYAPFFSDKTADAPVSGGILILVRERDIPPGFLLRTIAKRPLHQQIKRSFVILPKRISEPLVKHAKRSVIRFSSSGNRLSLFSRPGNWFSGLVANHGTIHLHFPAERLILQTSIDRKDLAHPLRKLVPELNRVLVLGTAAGTAFFLYLWLFGFTLPLRLRGKVLIGAGVASAVPLVLVLWGLLMQRQIDQDRSLAAVQDRLRMGHSLIERSLQGYLLQLTQRVLSLRHPFKDIIVNAASHTPYLQKQFDTLPIDAFSGVDGQDKAFFVRLRRDPEDFLERAQIEAIQGVLYGLLQGMRGQTLTKKPSITIHGLPFTPTGIGDELSRPAKFIPFPIGDRIFFLAALPVSPPAGQGGIASTGLILLRARPEDLIRDFFKRNADLMKMLQGTIGPWKITTIALPLDSSTGLRLPGTIWSLKQTHWTPFSRYADLTATFRQGFALSQSDRSHHRVISTFHIPRFPALILAWAEAPRENPWSGIPLGIAAYLLLLIWFVVSLLDQTFRRPILGFVQVADAIERGEYPRVPDQTRGDEFSGLGRSFDTMVQGLRHRDELSQFVSDDVMATLESGSEKALKPGGELMEVTVLFAGLRGFRQWAAAGTPDESVQVLNTFLETGSTVFRACGGNLDKIVEETLMAVFRQRTGLGDPAVRAVNAAFALQQTLAAAFPKTGSEFPQNPVCDIGIASGTVLSGRIGSHHGTLDFSVIGNAVNLAARLKAQAKRAQRTGIIVAPSTIRELHGRFRLEFLERVEIKGLSREFSLYEVVGTRTS